jgi:hypothetical protein
MTMAVRSAIILATILAAGIAGAQLTFENIIVEDVALPNDKKISGTYNFINSGDYDIKITDVKTTCGCTSASLDKKSFAPGESGSIPVTMKVGSRGVTERQVIVTTDEPGAQKLTLTVRATVEELIKVEPTTVRWNVGDTADAKTISIEAVSDNDINITDVKMSTEAFSYDLKTVETARSYKLIITPNSTTEYNSTNFTIQTDYPADNPQYYEATGRIMRVIETEPQGWWESFKVDVIRWIAD